MAARTRSTCSAGPDAVLPAGNRVTYLRQRTCAVWCVGATSGT